jgi:drug/metabolite transporter (DMT)-like permease
MIATAERHIASSTTAIAIATVPLLVALLTLRFQPSERVGGRRLAGLLVGLVGVAALVGIDVSGNGSELLGVGAALIAALGYAAGPIILKRHLSDLDPIASMGVCLAIAGAILTPLTALDLPGRAPSAGAVGAILVLGLICTALAMVLMAILVDEAGPSRASVITYINPVIAVALGIAFLGERPGAGAIAGLTLILAGSWLSTDGRLPAALERRRRAARRPRLQ